MPTLVRSPQDEVFDLVANHITGGMVREGNRMGMFAFIHKDKIHITYKDETFELKVKNFKDDN